MDNEYIKHESQENKSKIYDFGAGLLQLLAEKNLTQSELARRIGMRPTKINEYVKRGAMPSADTALDIAAALGVSVERLIRGTKENKAVSEVFEIPIFNAQFSAGYGSEGLSEEIVDYYKLDQDLLKRLGRTSITGLVIGEVVGDSLEPIIKDGSQVIIDTQDKRLREGIFVFRYGEHLHTKRLRPYGLNGIEIISENSLYSPQIVENENLKQFQILGRVIWAIGRV